MKSIGGTLKSVCPAMAGEYQGMERKRIVLFTTSHPFVVIINFKE